MKEIRLNGEIREVRAADENGARTFCGYAAMFNTVTMIGGHFEEEIAPGAFARAVNEDDVRLLLNHNPDHVLGRTKAGTLTLREDDTGLWFEGIAPDTQTARDLIVSMERGDINQCSFGFWVDAEEWTFSTEPGKPDHRLLKSLRLDDVSIVTYPAYADTVAMARDAKDTQAAARERDAAQRSMQKLEQKKLQIKRNMMEV